MDIKPPFEAIVSEHAATVWRVTRAILGDDADDSWSETFLAALTAYPALPATANVEAWLVRIAHNKAIDVTRRRATVMLADELDDRPSTLGIPGAAEPDLQQALQRLPHKQRHAVVYHYLAGLPYQAIADIVGGTADAARRASADGIRSLRLALTETPATHSVPQGGQP
ncbi:MAG TPA: sigma-70 family RNA polymerase sigma factor [Glaciihabitans sp.]|nr:sigma-70 family RNA polymerase sigma factor [Glaciihabitans sp.]